MGKPLTKLNDKEQKTFKPFVTLLTTHEDIETSQIYAEIYLSWPNIGNYLLCDCECVIECRNDDNEDWMYVTSRSSAISPCYLTNIIPNINYFFRVTLKKKNEVCIWQNS